MAATPLVGPEIEDVVQEDIGEERTDARPLRGTPVRLLPGGSCTRQWLRSTGGSPPFCVDTTATTAGRTTTQRSTDSIGKCAGYGYGVSETAQPEKPAHGLVGVRDPDGALPRANSAHHSNLGASTDMTRVNRGKSRVREIRPPGSVRAKAEWLSYSTATLRRLSD